MINILKIKINFLIYIKMVIYYNYGYKILNFNIIYFYHKNKIIYKILWGKIWILK
jgi:hypothetical protein